MLEALQFYDNKMLKVSIQRLLICFLYMMFPDTLILIQIEIHVIGDTDIYFNKFMSLWTTMATTCVGKYIVTRWEKPNSMGNSILLWSDEYS